MEGAPIVLEFFLPEGSFEVTNYYLSAGTMEEAFRAAGLRDVAGTRRGIARGPARARPGVLGRLPGSPAGGLHRVRQVGLRQRMPALEGRSPTQVHSASPGPRERSTERRETSTHTVTETGGLTKAV